MSRSQQNKEGIFQRFDSNIFDQFSRQISRATNRENLNASLIHSAAILFILFCGTCSWFAYQILQPFLRSILWSILAGAFLFPFKNHLTSISKRYLKRLEDDSHFLVFGLFFLLPLRAIDETIESIGRFCLSRWDRIVLVILFLPSMNFLNSGIISHWLSTISLDVYEKFISIVHNFDTPWTNAFVLAYLIAVIFIYKRSPLVDIFLNILSLFVWFVLLIYLSKYLPATYRIIVISLIIILTLIGLIVSLREYLLDKRKNENVVNRDVEENRRKIVQKSSSSSNLYFSIVLWGLLSIKIYRFGSYFLPVPIFVLLYKMTKFIIITTLRWLMKKEEIQNCLTKIKVFFHDRKNALAPSVLMNLFHIANKGDKKFNQALRFSIDFLVSAFMIVTLLIGLLIGAVIFVIQIRRESIHMINLTTNLVNEASIFKPLFDNVLSDREQLASLMDRAMNNFYVTARSWIVTKVNDLSTDGATNSQLEEEILHIFDRLYTYVTNTSTVLFIYQNETNNLPMLDKNLLNSNVFNQIVTNFDFGLNDFYQLVHNNLDVLRTVLHSVWSNTTVFLTLFSTIISFLFTSGFALFNFVVSFFVFITLLFYLLSHSDRPTYSPTEWLNNGLAIGGRNLGQTFNDAVTSVFVASLKMAAFYGLYTYVLHSLIGSNFVFLPTVIASVSAVILKSYWAALPGFFDLWLVQRRPLAALLLLIGQITPVYVVDTAIYSEVKDGGHEYLTALAIAGGVYYRGIEGALIGPIVLCCLIVAVRFYNESMVRTFSSSDEIVSNIQVQNHRRSHSLPVLNNL